MNHIPFRQCRLTHALQLALGHKSNVALLCAIRPQGKYINETLASLRFASRAAKGLLHPILMVIKALKLNFIRLNFILELTPDHKKSFTRLLILCIYINSNPSF